MWREGVRRQQENVPRNHRINGYMLSNTTIRSRLVKLTVSSGSTGRREVKLIYSKAHGSRLNFFSASYCLIDRKWFSRVNALKRTSRRENEGHDRHIFVIKIFLYWHNCYLKSSSTSYNWIIRNKYKIVRNDRREKIFAFFFFPPRQRLTYFSWNFPTL